MMDRHLLRKSQGHEQILRNMKVAAAKRRYISRSRVACRSASPPSMNDEEKRKMSNATTQRIRPRSRHVATRLVGTISLAGLLCAGGSATAPSPAADSASPIRPQRARQPESVGYRSCSPRDQPTPATRRPHRPGALRSAAIAPRAGFRRHVPRSWRETEWYRPCSRSLRRQACRS